MTKTKKNHKNMKKSLRNKTPPKVHLEKIQYLLNTAFYVNFKNIYTLIIKIEALKLYFVFEFIKFHRIFFFF